eukprot:5872766-Amphidinium_carterae.1
MGVQRGWVKTLKRWFEVLLLLESKIHESSAAQTIWRDLVWPGNHYVRFILVSLSEYEFKCVPEHLVLHLRAAFAGLASTQMVEDGHHYLRAEEKRAMNGQSSRAKRSSTTIHSKVLDQ